MDIRNSDMLKETINFVENIEFSDNIKTEIKEEEGLDQEVWIPQPFDVKPKIEPLEASETAQVIIKTEPEFFSNDETETLSNESIEIKDEFSWAMRDCVYDNVPPRIIEQQIADAHERKKVFECSICPSKFDQKGQLDRHISVVHEMKKPFECSLCPYKSGRKSDKNRHIAAVHEHKKPFKCSLCPAKFAEKGSLNTHIAAVHEHKKPFECPICPPVFLDWGI